MFIRNINLLGRKLITLPLFLSLIFFILFTSNINQINSQSKFDENLRIRNALEILPRFKGKGYSNKIEIIYENNEFKCNTKDKINPKEYTFVSNSGNSICSDKIFENFEILAEKISSEINQNLEPKILANVKFLNEFKQVLYFAYYLTYLDFIGENKTPSPKDKFFDVPKFSYTQVDIIYNLKTDNFNIFELKNEDLKILNNYLHTIIDINIQQLQEILERIINNIEKALSKKDGFKNWIPESRKNLKFFIGVVWRDAIHVDFE